MKRSNIFIAAAAAALLAGCAGANTSPVGLLDVQRLMANWPQYNTANDQMLADERAIETGKGSTASKQQQISQMNRRYASLSQQLVKQVQDAAAKVAQQKNLKLVVTREYVGYGGVDITPDVEKAMGITESSASPAPSGSP